MEILSGLKQYLLPAVLSLLAVSLLKMGLFVTFGDLEYSLRKLETAIRSEYATRQDIQDIKQMLVRMEDRLEKLDERLGR